MAGISFSGLSSGIDWNDLIMQMIQLEREPITTMETRISELEQVKNAWKDVNMRLYNLRSTVQGLKERDTFLAMQASSSSSSHVSATAGSKAEAATYELQVSQLATNHTVAMGTDIQTLLDKSVHEAMGLAGSFNLKNLATEDGTEDEGEYNKIEVLNSDSLTDLQNKINDAGAGVSASIIAGHLVLKSNVSGASNELEMAFVDGDDVLKALQLYDTDAGTFYNETIAAQDAHFSINGISAVRSSNTIDDLVEDLTFNLCGETDSSVYVQVSADTEKAVAALGSFVEQYNSVNEFIRESCRYIPGTEGKLDLNAEHAGERGPLQGDTVLMRIQQELRHLVGAPVSNYSYQDEQGEWQQPAYRSLAALGVTTVDKDGFLQLDVNKLESALQDDPEVVFSVLQFEVLDEEGAGTDTFSGVAVELDNYLRRMLETGYDSMGRVQRPVSVQQEMAVQQRIDELRKRIVQREEKLLRYEEQLVRRFTALEKYIAAMQEQSQQIGNMIGQFTGFGSSEK